MIEIRKTGIFSKWLDNVRDKNAKTRIASRLDRLSFGHLGDVKPVGENVSELRIHCGAGYRVYFTIQGKSVIILLCGGDKSSQSRDIKAAQLLAKQLKE